MQDGQPESPNSPESPWQFNPEENQAPAGAQQADEPANEQVSWTASEYIAHEKSLGWFVLLGLFTVGLAGLVYLVTRDRMSTGVIFVIAVLFGAFAARPPRELEYAVDNKGIHVGGKTYFYSQFKSFSLVEEGAVHSIMFMPLQRFMPPLSIYFAPQDEDRIVNVLSNHLPYEQHRPDVVDRLTRRIRF
jgi:hypothetical protein